MNPADQLIADYQQADGLAAWNIEMMHRCRLTVGKTAADLLLRGHQSFCMCFNR